MEEKKCQAWIESLKETVMINFEGMNSVPAVGTEITYEKVKYRVDSYTYLGHTPILVPV